MMKAYFLATNGDNCVILTDGDTAKVFNGAPDGCFEGVDLYRTYSDDDRLDYASIVIALENRFASLERSGALNDYSDIYSPFEVEYAELESELEKAIMVYTSERVKVFYGGGESRYNPGMAVDYMITDFHGHDLYAELPVNTQDECANMLDLEAKIKRQVIALRKYGYSPVELEFDL